MTTDPITTADEFFDAYSGSGGGGGPAFKFDAIGDVVKGEIISTRVLDQRDYRTNNLIPDPKRPGQMKKQLQVVLQTTLRNWAGCKQGKDAEGKLLPPEADTGARAVYVKGWMTGAVGDAVHKATGGASRTPVPKGILAVMFSTEEDTGRGRPLKKYEANYKAPATGSDLFEEDATERTAQATQAATGATALNLDEDEIVAPF